MNSLKWSLDYEYYLLLSGKRMADYKTHTNRTIGQPTRLSMLGPQSVYTMICAMSLYLEKEVP